MPTRTVTADAVTYGNTATVKLTLSDLYGRNPVGNASLTIDGATYTAAVANGVATFTTPVLTAGNKDYSISYTTDSQIVGFTQTGTLGVNKVAVSNVVGLVTKAPTKKAVGALKVTVTAPAGLAAVGGTVAVTITSAALKVK